jgi:4-amino-4-deoxy-L-arabinose transferase-like glycosyltransferase
MAERVRRSSYIRTWIGVAICLYAVTNFSWHLDRPNYIGLAVFLVVGVLLIASGFMRSYTRRDWINEEYAKQLAVDDGLKRSDARARLFRVAGLILALFAVVWIIYGMNRFGPAKWTFTLEIAACIAAPGLALMAYHSVIVGVGQFRAIRRAREKLSNDEHDLGSVQ